MIVPEQTKTCTKCGAEKNIEEFYKKAKGKYGVTSWCKACCNKISCKWAKDNRERHNENRRNWHANNAEKSRRLSREQYRANPQATKERNRRRYWADPVKPRLERRKYYVENIEDERRRHREWRLANPEKAREKSQRYYARKVQAVPEWVDYKKIRLYYKQACVLSKKSGVPYQVDHIVPLVSALVCGLHSQHNLAVVTAAENQSKGNRVWPDMP